MEKSIFKGLLLLAFLSFGTYGFSQVGIGTTGDPDASSMLEIQSTAKGVLIPRMTEAQRTGISGPATGLLVFDTTHGSFWYFSTVWTELSTGTPNKIIDADGDTRIEVEKNADEDKIRFTTVGMEYMQIGVNGDIKMGNRGPSTLTGGISSGRESDEAGLENYTKITADGSLSYIGNATRWDDLKVPVNSVKIKNTTEGAEWGTFLGGTVLLWFKDQSDSAKESDVVFTVQMPHAWKEGSTIYPHVHWTAKGTAPGTNRVTWGLEYTWISVGGVFPDTTTITGTTVATPNEGSIALNEHVITPIGTAGIDGTGKTLSSMLVCRLFRNSSNATDTYSSEAGLLEIDFHYQIDSDGSNQEYTKE